MLLWGMRWRDVLMISRPETMTTTGSVQTGSTGFPGPVRVDLYVDTMNPDETRVHDIVARIHTMIADDKAVRDTARNRHDPIRALWAVVFSGDPTERDYWYARHDHTRYGDPIPHKFRVRYDRDVLTEPDTGSPSD